MAATISQKTPKPQVQPSTTNAKPRSMAKPASTQGGVYSQSLLQRAEIEPLSLTRTDLHRLSLSSGQQAVQRVVNHPAVRQSRTIPVAMPIFRPMMQIQAQLTVGPVGDKYEREADRLANLVTSSSAPVVSRVSLVQRYSLNHEKAGGNVAMQRNKMGGNAQHIQAIPTISRIQRSAPVGPAGGAVDSKIESRIRSSQSGGSSMPTKVRSNLESKLGADFSNIKVHTDSSSVQLNRDLGAKAFTHKNHIFYGAGQSPNDMKLTAHEAVHTVQQGAAASVQRKAGNIVPPADKGTGIIFRSTLKQINSKITDYNALETGNSDMATLVKEKKLLGEIIALIESWMVKHVGDVNLDPETERKKTDLERVYGEVESEIYLVNNAIEDEKQGEANRTGQAYKETGATFLDNWNSLRGDVVYGISKPRTVYTSAAKGKTPGAYWYTMDDYNNFFGIGTGDAYKAAAKGGELGDKQGKMDEHLDSQLATVDSHKDLTTASMKDRAKAYHKNIKGSKYDPKKSLAKGEHQLTNNAATWATGDNRLLNLQYVKGIREACKFGIEMVATKEPFASAKAIIHFVLDGLGDLADIAKKKTTTSDAGDYLAITSSELRFVYRNWARFRHAIKFYYNQKEVPAPWAGGWSVKATKSKETLSGKLAWRDYGRRSRMGEAGREFAGAGRERSSGVTAPPVPEG